MKDDVRHFTVRKTGVYKLMAEFQTLRAGSQISQQLPTVR